MNKTLFKSIREYKKQSLLAPFLVILEVLMEVLIPLEMAKIIDVGIANGDLGYIVQRGIILVAMAMLALFFGVQAGNMAAVAAAGEYPSSGKSTDHDSSFLDHDTADQCKDCTSVPDRNPASWWNTDVYSKESASTFYQSI